MLFYSLLFNKISDCPFFFIIWNYQPDEISGLGTMKKAEKIWQIKCYIISLFCWFDVLVEMFQVEVEWQDMLWDMLSVSLSPDTCRCYSGVSGGEKNAQCAFAWGSRAAQYLWLITLHATATVKHGSEEAIWFMGLENCWEGGLKNKDVTWHQVQQGHFPFQ